MEGTEGGQVGLRKTQGSEDPPDFNPCLLPSAQSRQSDQTPVTTLPLRGLHSRPCLMWGLSSLHQLGHHITSANREDNALWLMLFLFHKPVVITENKSTFAEPEVSLKSQGRRRDVESHLIARHSPPSDSSSLKSLPPSPHPTHFLCS